MIILVKKYTFMERKNMKDIYIVAAKRTPFGKYRGFLRLFRQLIWE